MRARTAREGVPPMAIIAITPAAVTRPRVLSASPAVSSRPATSLWRLDVPSAFATPVHHNSNATALRIVAVATTGVMSADAGNGGYIAAKQAAPPRGIPR